MIEVIKNAVSLAVQDLESELLKVDLYFEDQDRIKTVKAQDTPGQTAFDPLFGGYTPQVWTPKPKTDWVLFPPIPEDHFKTFVKEIRPRRQTQRLWNRDGVFYWNHIENLVNMFISLNKDLIDQEFEVNNTLDVLSHNICSDQVNLDKPERGFFRSGTDDHLTRAFKLSLDHKIRELIKGKSNRIEDLISELKPLSKIGFDTGFEWTESPETIKIMEQGQAEALARAFVNDRHRKQKALTDQDGFDWSSGEFVKT